MVCLCSDCLSTLIRGFQCAAHVCLQGSRLQFEPSCRGELRWIMAKGAALIIPQALPASSAGMDKASWDFLALIHSEVVLAHGL
jgi:hypothetical protein